MLVPKQIAEKVVEMIFDDKNIIVVNLLRLDNDD
jgi:hypothetical protein